MVLRFQPVGYFECSFGSPNALCVRIGMACLESAALPATLVVTRHGHSTEKLLSRPGVQLIEAGHPYPDAQSIHAAEVALEIAHGLEAQDQLLVLLSGGGSALLAAPAHGMTLADKQATTRALLESGADDRRDQLRP